MITVNYTIKNVPREEKNVYALTIVAEDGQFSSLLKNNRPNQTPQKFRIVIKDKNDNPPYFPQQVRGPFLLLTL